MNSGYPRARTAEYLLLALAVVLGVFLRWNGLGWGEDSASYHPDEQRIAEMADGLRTNSEFPRSYVFFFPQLVRAAEAMGGNARIISFVAGCLLIGVVFCLARLLAPGHETLAAAFVATNTLCIIHAHFGTADTVYTVLLCLFAWSVLREKVWLAAVVAGLAMATKFGLILIPSLIFLLWQLNSRARRAGFLTATAFVFFAAQGFAFNMESVHAIWRSFTLDNAGGFEHNKLLNVLTYAGVMIRALGLPVVGLLVLFLARRSWTRPPVVQVVALLPFALHGVGLLLINTAFPRHALPLIPVACIAAAAGVGLLPRHRIQLAAVCLAWSLALAWSDGTVFRVDPRERAKAWMETNVSNTVRVWADPHHHGKAWHTSADRPSEANLLVLTEAWTWRFERSEINPLGAPSEAELYHATASDLAWYLRLNDLVAQGTWKKIYEACPLHILPEQFAYAAAWGSFEKFAGRCAVYAPVN